MANTLRMTFQAYGTAQAFTLEVATVSMDALQTLNIGSASAGAGAGKVTFNPFSFTRKPDVHSPDFWLRLCGGTPFQKVLLESLSAVGSFPYFSFTMGLAAVKTVAFSSASDGSPLEVITLEYGQAAYSVCPQNPDGSFGKPVATAWDRVRNISVDPAKVGTI